VKGRVGVVGVALRQRPDRPVAGVEQHHQLVGGAAVGDRR
jgi:hypothetical protein